MLTFRIFICSVIITMVVAIKVSTNENAQNYCGPMLTSAMEKLCKNKYQGYPAKQNKRFNGLIGNEDTIEFNLNNDQMDYDYEYLRQPLYRLLIQGQLTGLNNNNHIKKRSSNYFIQNGIIAECCFKPCKESTLALYCQSA